MIKSDSCRVIRMVQHMRSINVIHHVNKRKGKRHIIISVDAKKKKFDKIQHPFIIKAFIQVGIERTNQHNKGHLQQIHSQHNPQRWKPESLLGNSEKKTRMPTLTPSIQYSIEIARGFSRRKRSKMGRSPTFPQTHQKYICMWNNFYRTSLEHWKNPGFGTQTSKKVNPNLLRMRQGER